MNQIPEIEFSPGHEDDSGFEIITIEKIKSKKESYDSNPELPHQLNFFNLIFYTNGTSKQFIDFKWYSVQKNSLVYLSKKQINAFSFTPELQGFCLLFSQEYFEKCFSHLDKEIIFRLFSPQLFQPTSQIPQDSDIEQYINLLYKEFHTDNKFNKKAIIESLFTIILTKAEQLKKNQSNYFPDNSKTKLFSQFSILVEKNYRTNRNADFYAKKLAITYKHLNIICKELTNSTAKKFIDDFVILEAKRQLVNTEVGSTKLAYSLGFDEPTNFIKFFKKRTGITPKQFIKEAINK